MDLPTMSNGKTYAEDAVERRGDAMSEQIAQLLAAHRLYGEEGDDTFECGCGLTSPDDCWERDFGEAIWHQAHLADAIAAHIGAVLDGLREEVVRGTCAVKAGDEPHVTCARAADAALAVVRAAMGLERGSGGAESDAGAGVAESDGGEIRGPQMGCEHEWSKRGHEGDPWSECWLCGEVRNGHHDSDGQGER